jgi:hypothetical protein
MHDVDIVAGLKHPAKSYLGTTTHLDNRLAQPNAGRNGSRKQYAPWRVESYVAFSNERMAWSFERGLEIRLRSRLPQETLGVGPVNEQERQNRASSCIAASPAEQRIIARPDPMPFRKSIQFSGAAGIRRMAGRLINKMPTPSAAGCRKPIRRAI